MRSYGRKYKVVTWSSYRKIPDYQKTLEKISSQRDEILLFIAQTLMAQPNLEEIKIEIADLAGKLSIPFDEALYYKWNYCQKLHQATEKMKAINYNKQVL